MAENVRAIKRRIGNIEDIRQITKAMNAIAMTKLTRMKRRLEPARPYVTALESFIAALLAQGTEVSHPLLADNGSTAVGVLALNADRGLCGRFQGEINRRAEEVVTRDGARSSPGREGAGALLHPTRDRDPARLYPPVRGAEHPGGAEDRPRRDRSLHRW